MEVSKKELKEKGNWAAGYLINAVLWTFYFTMTGLRIFNEYSDTGEVDVFNLVFVIFWFVVGIPVSVWRWRREDKQYQAMKNEYGKKNVRKGQD